MKKAKLISLLLIIVIIGAYSLNATMDEDGVLLVPVVDDTPIIDGELDNVWKCVTATRMDSVEGGGIAVSTNNYDDHYSKFRVMYDEDYFYVFVEVVDDQLDVTAADPWNKDCIEIFFDGGNEKTFEGYDDNDVQWRWVLGQDNEDDPSGGNYAWDTTDVGFNFEIGIPVDSLEALDLALEEYHEFGFEISNNDGDDGERKEVKHWWTADGNTWQYAHLFGTGLLLSEDDREVEEFLDIQYTEDGDDIVIDGIMSEDEPWFEEGVATLSPNEVEGGMARDTLLDTDGDKDYIFKLLWDEDYLYFFYESYDDQLDVTAADPWNKDCIELFFDGGNEKTFEGYDDNDVQWRWVLGDNIDTDPSGGNFAWDTTDVGFNFEMKIPADSLENIDLDLQNNHEFGLEVSSNDGDDGARNLVRHWWTADGNTWQYAHLFGSAFLAGGPESAVDDDNVEIARNFHLSQNYPNPFNPTTNITFSVNKREMVKVVVYDMLGKKVETLYNDVANVGKMYNLEFNGANLSSGIYFYTLKSESKNISKKMLLLK